MDVSDVDPSVDLAKWWINPGEHLDQRAPYAADSKGAPETSQSFLPVRHIPVSHVQIRGQMRRDRGIDTVYRKGRVLANPKLSTEIPGHSPLPTTRETARHLVVAGGW
uniref:Uncharacterized protein n=1 Tax=Bracon brevicornis TaxID=1563983 RepID=A0A6V7JB50_9HYME